METKNQKNISNLRKQIDALDHKIVLLLAKRFKVTGKIILLKKANGLPIKDGSREMNIFFRVEKLAEKLKISKVFIRDIYKEILKESKKK